ncbi:MAG: MBOAT family protein [Clostridia bacterium]|nr:MBOAT family protein [Clostridia bacterium]
MSFTSFSFLCFFALCLVGFFALPQRLRPWLLLAASLGFYAAAGLPALGWLFATAAVSWGAGRCVSAGRHPGAAYAGAVVCHLGLLFALKYLNFFAGREILTLAIPAGLSFFTFMAVSYVTDVRRGICPAEKNFGRYLLYLSFFPHVLQGPIDRYAGLTPGLFAGAGFEERRFLRGAWRMLWGFFEKLVIADRLGILVAAVWKEPEAYAGWRVAAAVVCYALQIYADFAGYMDVALGAGEIFGITLAENFDTPYFSRSVPEFWRRWHITLGAWFRDYLFYPLQRTGAFRRLGKFLKGKFGKQAAKNLPAALALAAVWLFTGLWHGARLTYVAWGAYYGLLIILSMLCEPLCARLRPKKKSLLFEAFRMARTFAAVCLGYVLFRSASMGEAWRVLVRIFTAPFAAGKGFSAAGLGMADYAVLAFALGLRLLVSLCRVKGVDLREKLLALPLPLRWGAALALIFSVILFGIYGPGYDAASFIYFEF